MGAVGALVGSATPGCGNGGSDTFVPSGGSAGQVQCMTGDEGCPCYPNDTCNDDLLCRSSVCRTDQGSGSGGTASGAGGRPGQGGAAAGSGPASGGSHEAGAPGADGGSNASGGSSGGSGSAGAGAGNGGSSQSGGTANGGAGVGGSQGGSGGSGPNPRCENPWVFDMATGAFTLQTTDAVCAFVPHPIVGYGCSDGEGRTLTINGDVWPCIQQIESGLPDPVDGGYYFHFTAGTNAYTTFYWWVP
jgi:hypothetical protein